MTGTEQQTWFHGSPLRIDVLRKGSTITRNEKLAQVFSTKPAIVSVSDNGSIKHNGTEIGFIYTITDAVSTDDIYKHPGTTMPDGWEWITKQDFHLKLLYQFTSPPDDLLTESEIESLKKT